MELRAEYAGRRERPRLTVVRDGGVQGRFSALPHDIVRKKGVSRDARLLVAVLQMYGWNGGEITASHATLAADMDCGLKSLRAYLNELIEAGILAERDAGVRRQKVYTLTFNTAETTHWEESNTSKTTDCEQVNAQVLPVQCVVLDDSNTSKTTHSKKKTPVKKTQEEDLPPTGVGAAVAATPPAEAATSKKIRRTRAQKPEETSCPEMVELNEQSYATAATWGYSREAVNWQMERFLSKARSKGWLYVDWKAAFRNWLLNEVEYAKRDGRSVSSPPARTGSALRPSGPPQTIAEKWAGWEGRGGSNLKPPPGATDGR